MQKIAGSEMLSPDAKKSLAAVAEKYASALQESPDFPRYLTDHGIDRAIAQDWGLGRVKDPISAHKAFRDRLAIPYWAPDGSGVVAMKFRCMRNHVCKDEQCAKYLSHAGAGRRLFGVMNFSVNTGVFAISEGETDAIVATELLGIPTVACPGATAWQSWWKYLFEGYDKVLVLGDGDEAGRVFADQVAGVVPNGEARPMPPGLDVSSFVRRDGVGAVTEWLGL